VQQLGTDAAMVWRQEMEALHLGQGMDIDWREKANCPSEEEYLWMVAQSSYSSTSFDA
jgi:geranylgeranyl pyrophosphate synthase